MNHLHGIRLTPLHHEMTPFEKQLAKLDQQCRHYHQKKSEAAPANESPAEKIKREKALKTELKHLDNERRHAQNLAIVQAGLDNYRNELRIKRGDTRDSMAVKRDVMHSEKHHPTAQLEMFMRADGRPKPSKKHTAHHMVPGQGKTPSSYLARVQLHLHGVRINDPDNGVWMISHKKNAGHWSMPNAKTHLEIHTHNYERWVHAKVRSATSESTLRAELIKIRIMLENGTQPKQVTMPPQNNWNGN